jgi:hypothetical protein
MTEHSANIPRQNATITSENDVESSWKISNVSDTVDDPIADCLVILSRIYGQPISRTALRAGLPLEKNRLSVSLAARAAARAGLSSRVLSRSIHQMSTLELPCILLLAAGKACVLTDRYHARVGHGQGTSSHSRAGKELHRVRDFRAPVV